MFAEVAHLVDAELERAKRAAAHRKQPTPRRDVPNGEAIRRMTEAALPAVQRDAIALQRVRAENEITRQQNERALSHARAIDGV